MKNKFFEYSILLIFFGLMVTSCYFQFAVCSIYIFGFFIAFKQKAIRYVHVLKKFSLGYVLILFFQDQILII